MATRILYAGAELIYDPALREFRAINPEQEIMARDINATYIFLNPPRTYIPNYATYIAEIIRKESGAEILELDLTPGIRRGRIVY